MMNFTIRTCENEVQSKSNISRFFIMISVLWAAKYLCKLRKIKKKRDEWIILLSSANTEHPLQLSLVCSDGTLHANMIMLLIFVNLQGVLSYMNMRKTWFKSGIIYNNANQLLEYIFRGRYSEIQLLKCYKMLSRLILFPFYCKKQRFSLV